ncbi:hypothetical protein [Corynebacterium coyleae]|uniref:hypothetical protein n=1 Tax=Corynebacterium coyleae TaxID=53374 RepID=UPI0015E0CAF0|nr:hypothetical protein [Corynebacterium coyleae]
MRAYALSCTPAPTITHYSSSLDARNRSNTPATATAGVRTSINAVFCQVVLGRFGSNF